MYCITVLTQYQSATERKADRHDRHHSHDIIARYCIDARQKPLIATVPLCWRCRSLTFGLAFFGYLLKKNKNKEKQVFWLSYCQISTDLDKILHTPEVVRSSLVGRLRPRSVRGRLQAKPKTTMIFVILVTHPKSYIETTDRRDFGGKPSKWKWGRVLSWKFLEFYSVAGARSKNSIFLVLEYPSGILRTVYRKQFYSKLMVPMESRNSEGVPFPTLESLWPGIWQI